MTFLAGVAAGLLGAWAVTLMEPVQRWLGRQGRSTFGDTGIQVHVEEDPAVIWAGQPDWEGFNFYVPDPGPKGPPPSNPREWHNWVSEVGGWDQAESVIRVTLVATAPVAVIVETPQIMARVSPLPPGCSLTHSVGGADMVPRAFYVDLGTFGPDSPIVSLVEEYEPQHLPRTFSLKKDEVEQFLIRVCYAEASLVHWWAKIPVIVDGKREFLRIDNAGDGYVFAGGTMGDGLTWNNGEWHQLHRGHGPAENG